MIQKKILRRLVLEVFKKTQKTQISAVLDNVENLVVKYDLFPTLEACQKLGVDYHYYQQKELNPLDKDNISEIAWDLIFERILTPDERDRGWPFLRLTQFGHEIIAQTEPHYYDPDGYIEFLKSKVTNLDSVIEQYIFEGLNCFKRQLFFASAVMVGAAAEKIILLLVESIKNSISNPQQKKEIERLLESPRLPTIFAKIMEILVPLTENGIIPYSIHQGCSEHLMSLFEMIRVQRNNAVHPIAGKANRDNVFLSLQTFSVALQLIYGLIKWFENNTI